MSGVSFATRRMWLKRWNRVGWFITGVLKIPFYPAIWVFQFLRAWFRSWDDRKSDMYIGGWFMIIITIVISGVTVWQMHLSRDATLEELRAARAADTCFDGTIVRRAAEWKRPVRIRDVVVLQDDCAEMWANIKAMEAQKAALAAQLK